MKQAEWRNMNCFTDLTPYDLGISCQRKMVPTRVAFILTETTADCKHKNICDLYVMCYELLSSMSHLNWANWQALLPLQGTQRCRPLGPSTSAGSISKQGEAGKIREKRRWFERFLGNWRNWRNMPPFFTTNCMPLQPWASEVVHTELHASTVKAAYGIIILYHPAPGITRLWICWALRMHRGTYRG